MRRTLPVCAVLLTIPLLVGADAPPKIPDLVVRMTVQPRPAPKPALKYQLLPELREMNPGNPIQGYLKSFMEQTYLFHNKQAQDKREKWREMPLKDLPLKEKELQEYCTNAGLSQADYAARLDTPDWQILLKLKSDGVNVLLPDLQRLRYLAEVLQIRFRVEIAERRFSDALTTAKTMLALSRHCGEHPTFIGELCGIAIGTIALSRVDEMIQQAGCPNLFWALTDLPIPFINLRTGLQGERVWVEAELTGLDDREPMSERQLHKVVDRLVRATKNGNIEEETVRQWLEGRSRTEEHLRAARKRLVEALAPADPTKFESFPPLQIVLLDEKLKFEVQRDEQTKALALPYWQARNVVDSIPPVPRDKETPLTLLIAQYFKVKGAQARLDQRIGLLRCVEALRIYAAEHNGKLPAKLEDIHLPLPVDPATGKPFSYKVDGKTSYLQGEPLSIRVRYEVTIAK